MAVVCDPTTPTKLNSVVLTDSHEEESSLYDTQSTESSSLDDVEDSLTLRHDRSHGINTSQITFSDTASRTGMTVEKGVIDSNLTNEAECQEYIWTTSYQANDPCEDRYASLIGVELLHGDNDNEADSVPMSSPPVIRMGLFGVFDGHGGSAVAEFAACQLLPMLKINIARALGCHVSHDGTFCVNGKTIHKLSVDTAIRTRQQDLDNIDSDNDEESTSSGLESEEDIETSKQGIWYQAPDPLPSSTTNHSLMSPGKHTPLEREIVLRTIQETFIQLDELWMNSIDVKKKQHSLFHSGSWNAGSCALVNILLQREESGKRGPGILYSAHTGDCRGVLFSVQEKNDVSGLKEKDVEDVVDIDHDSSKHGINCCSSSDDDQELTDIQCGGKRNVFMNLSGTNSNQSMAKRRRLSTIDGMNQM